MDRVIERKRRPLVARLPLIIVLSLSVGVALYYLASNSIGSPVLDKETLRIGTVKRGPFSVQVLGNGQIAAKDPDWVVARVAGQVVQAPVKAGQWVAQGDLLLELSNDEIAAAYAKSHADVQAAEADFALLKANLESQHTARKAAVIHARLDHKQIQARYDALTRLQQTSVIPIPELEYMNTKVSVEQAEGKLAVAQLELDSFTRIEAAQTRAGEFRFAAIQQEHARIKKQFSDLHIRASRAGIVQNIHFNPGEGVTSAALIAQIVDPRSVYVTLTVPAIQATKLAPNQAVTLDINRKQIQAHVHRVDPNIKGSIVEVDVYFNDAAPADSKIGMYVSGTIYVHAIDDAFFVEIPSMVAEHDRMMVYRLNPDGAIAQLTEVKSGALSAHFIQIIEGLNAGDKIILSDIPDRQDAHTFRLH